MADVYLHMGDANHRPLLTLHALSKAMLRKLVAECRRDRWPFKVAIGSQTVSVATALRSLPGRTRR